MSKIVLSEKDQRVCGLREGWNGHPFCWFSQKDGSDSPALCALYETSTFSETAGAMGHAQRLFCITICLTEAILHPAAARLPAMLFWYFPSLFYSIHPAACKSFLLHPGFFWKYRR